jgi:hypothetical protein
MMGRGSSSRDTATGLIIGAAAIALVSLLIAVLKQFVAPLGLTGLYLFAILPVAVGWGFLLAGIVAVASFLTFAYFFSPHVHSFHIAEGDTAAALVIALLTAYLVNELARRAQERAREARSRAQEAERAQTELRRLAEEQAALQRIATLVAQAVPTASPERSGCSATPYLLAWGASKPIARSPPSPPGPAAARFIWPSGRVFPSRAPASPRRCTRAAGLLAARAPCAQSRNLR